MKINYFNDRSTEVWVYVGDLNATPVSVKSQRYKKFEIKLLKGQQLFIKEWDSVILISYIDKNAARTSWDL